jgi:hypothetical protein
LGAEDKEVNTTRLCMACSLFGWHGVFSRSCGRAGSFGDSELYCSDLLLVRLGGEAIRRLARGEEPLLRRATPHLANAMGYAMASLDFKLSILQVLARWPERRATLDEIKREIEIIVVNGDQIEQLKRFSALHDVHIFQSGLVSRDDDGFQITEAGLSLLDSFESSGGFSREASSAATCPPFRLIDDLIGTEERLKIFDLELRTLEGGAEAGEHQSEHVEEHEAAPIEAPDAALEACTTELSANTNSQGLVGAAEDKFDQSSENAPAFLRLGFGSKAQELDQDSSPLVRLLASTATKTRSMLALWRNHFARGESTSTEPVIGRAGGVAFAFLSLLVLVSCVGAAIALRQMASLKSEIATLHRDLLPLRERVGKLEQTEKAKRESDQQEAAPNKSGTAANKPGEDNRTDQGGLSLSREEVELIRSYIKPAPSADIAAPAINVGDAFSGATIPLPSQLAEKIPRLLGARFTTRGGTIIIVKKDSRRADAVLAAN